MGEAGVGQRRGKFKPVSLLQADSTGVFKPLPAIGNPEILTLPAVSEAGLTQQITLEFLTPLRLLSGGKPMRNPPAFTRLVASLAQHITALASVYGAASWIEFEAELQSAKEIRVLSSSLRWIEWNHYSGTKKEQMSFDGHTGFITYHGNITEYMPLLAAGEVLHVGSTVTFGLGKYRILLNE
jgi:hypothetical protein